MSARKFVEVPGSIRTARRFGNKNHVGFRSRTFGRWWKRLTHRVARRTGLPVAEVAQMARQMIDPSVVRAADRPLVSATVWQQGNDLHISRRWA